MKISLYVPGIDLCAPDWQAPTFTGLISSLVWWVHNIKNTGQKTINSAYMTCLLHVMCCWASKSLDLQRPSSFTGKWVFLLPVSASQLLWKLDKNIYVKTLRKAPKNKEKNNFMFHFWLIYFFPNLWKVKLHIFFLQWR